MQAAANDNQGLSAPSVSLIGIAGLPAVRAGDDDALGRGMHLDRQQLLVAQAVLLEIDLEHRAPRDGLVLELGRGPYTVLGHHSDRNVGVVGERIGDDEVVTGAERQTVGEVPVAGGGCCARCE